MNQAYDQRIQLSNREEQNRTKNVSLIDQDAMEIIEHFKSSIDNIKDRFKVVNLLTQQKMIEEANDVLRFQIVYAMSALDFFMHEIFAYSLIKIFRSEKPKTGKFNEYRVPIKLVEYALKKPEQLDVELKEAFIEINSPFTYMSPGRMREILNVISPIDDFARVEMVLKNKHLIPQDVRLDHILESIYIRRNKIAHQTDIDHGQVEKNSISYKEVHTDIQIVEVIGEELYKIICES